ncbi:hypothetical protein [Dyadobacter arcticus]|uniref:DUF2157 domain-containing protein n=1 Tax=Dyadobacter arcticus TaxID=1078754 RepID=A0ABX0UL87_9BACT|nr:hypothetical protein [Dyadobacter arcticus]NIJ53667.1 hypothetical protein [Dyadobacter arcticus]
MKKAYNLHWIENLYISQVSSRWRAKNLLTPEQEAQIKVEFPEEFYRPGIFVKIGLFIFATIACSFFVGFISIFFLEAGGDDAFSFLSMIACVCYLISLEYLIKNRKLFHSGVDNALLYAAITAAFVPMFILFEDADVLVYCIFSLILFTLATLRYADLLTTIGCFGALFTLLASLMLKFPLSKALLPFAIMILAAGIYFSIRNNRSLYYADCIKVLKALSLVTFYLGGNYFIVREGNALLNELNLPVSPQIAFAPVFYFFTTAIPAFYVIAGLKRHDRVLFIIGLLTFAFSIYTYRSFFSQLTIAQELLVAGIVMIAAAVSVIKYLHTPKHRVSDEQEGQRKLANLEAIWVAQNLGQAPQENGLEFGGGNFGGGGAGEVY